MKRHLLPLFELLDPVNRKNWPAHFLDFLKEKSKIPPSNAAYKKFLAGTPFEKENALQLAFGERVEERATECKRVINGFFNPFWTDDYGSGGNEAGHLLMLRKHYHNTEFSSANAKRKVSQYLRDMKSKKKDQKSSIDTVDNRRKTKFQITVDCTKSQEKQEIKRIAVLEAERFTINWFPNQWLAFYLFGLPCHGAQEPFDTIVSGLVGEKLKKQTQTLRTALSNLNTEVAGKDLRRADPVRKVADDNIEADDDEDEDALLNADSRKKRKTGNHDGTNEGKTITVRHEIAVMQGQKQPESTAVRSEKEYENLKQRMQLLNEGYLESDEETGFSVKAEKKMISKRMYSILSARNENG
jgi:hypothetical protein